ncbi:MAG: type secretion C-terminal target protein [Proteobacteria bacterium]|nr:type secretion C-terminal target protein [Pseudomonadota bacterium]
MQRVTLLLIAHGRYGRLSVLTLLLPVLCGLFLVSAVSAPPAVLADPSVEAASAKPRTFASYYRDATVFRDRKRNQVFDPGERYSVTGADGRFDPPKGNGRLYLIGGTRIDTGEINTLTLTAPPQARAISTLTALWQALLDKRQSQAKITKMLGLARHTKVLDFQVALADDLGSASPKKKKIVRADAQNDTLVRFLQALSLGASRPRTIQGAVAAAPSGLGSIDALAQGLIKLRPTKLVDLTDQTTSQKIYVTAFSRLGTTLGPGELENLAAGTVRLNQMIAQDQLGIALATRACILSLLPETSFDIAFNYCLMPPPAPIVAKALAAVSRNATPTLNGTADSRILTVRVYRNGVLVDTVPVVANAWSYTSPPLPDGRYLFEVKGINAAGVEGIPSAAMPTEIRTSPPAAPTVTPHTANSFTPTITGNWSGAAGDSLAVTVKGHRRRGKQQCRRHDQ